MLILNKMNYSYISNTNMNQEKKDISKKNYIIFNFSGDPFSRIKKGHLIGRFKNVN